MGYRVPVLNKFSWQEPVSAIVSAPAGGEVKGTRYLVGAAPSGEFAGHANEIAWYDGSTWNFDFNTRPNGLKVYNQDDDSYWMWNGATWTNATNVGDMTITGDTVAQEDAVSWRLPDNEEKALTFDVYDGASPAGPEGMLRFDTRNGQEKITSSVGLQVDGVSQFKDNVVIEGNLRITGSTTTIETEQLVIEDPIFTLNHAGDDLTSVGAGMEVEGDSTSIVAFFRTYDAGWEMSAYNDKVLQIETLENVKIKASANLDIEGDTKVNQNLRNDADVTFQSVTAVTGTYSGNVSAGSLDVAAKITADTLDTTSDVTIGGNLNVTGDIEATDITATNDLSVTNDATIGGDVAITGDITSVTNIVVSEQVTDGGDNSVSVANMQKSYDSRAFWDADLECLVFNQDALDAAE